MPGRKIVPLRRIGQIVLSGITVDTIDPAYYTVAHGDGQRTAPQTGVDASGHSRGR
jgi:hypothetical protein